MGAKGDHLAAIDAINMAGLNAELWPQALAAVTRLIGGAAGTLEILDRKTFEHREFHAYGVAPAGELAYVREYAALSPRIPGALRQKAGEVTWDYRVVDERAIDRSPFYMEFLAPQGYRYAVAGILDVPRQELGVVAVQRSRRHGHVDRSEVALMERLVPHVSRAVDVMTRLKQAEGARRTLEHALDWLADGVALVRADGTVSYANQVLQAIVRRADAIRICDGAIECADSDARLRLDAAIAAVRRLRDGGDRAPVADFPAPRSGGAPPYLVSVRTLTDGSLDSRASAQAIAMVFVHDPLSRHATTLRLLRDVFGLTDAEGALAQALRAGTPLADYARAHGVSVNTVYTHLRRIKEKTGCHRMGELIRKLDDLEVPLRPA